jgi:hypothetical protein
MCCDTWSRLGLHCAIRRANWSVGGTQCLQGFSYVVQIADELPCPTQHCPRGSVQLEALCTAACKPWAALCHAGQVLERINGKSCSKVIAQKSFNDVWYIRSMLKQTFVALDAAQRAYGWVLHMFRSHAVLY